MDEKLTKLSETELLIMQLIWDIQKSGGTEITAGEMMNRYPEKIAGRNLTTVLTLITRLRDKGFISIEKTGRSNYYLPLVSEEDYKDEMTTHFITTMYRDSPKSLIMNLFNSKKLDEGEIAELKEWMDKNI